MQYTNAFFLPPVCVKDDCLFLSGETTAPDNMEDTGGLGKPQDNFAKIW
jgi:hypothetical protein